MRFRTIAVIGATAAVLSLGAWWLLRGDDDPVWRTAVVRRGDVQETVSSTGTLDAVRTVLVGTQVSGLVSEILVDFNDQVEAGQVIAHIDTSLLDADVASARARLAVAEAEKQRAGLDLTRVEGLRARGAATDQELETARAADAVADADARTARISLERAQLDLGYATITSPIAGTVISRDVDVGQTVNAGFSAPTLFTIAEDLSRMQILASVDEADIGRIREGQSVEFTVQPWPEERFPGNVHQVRLQSTVVENVVTYVAVIDVDNDAGRLLPGLTATVDFVVAEATDVLCVPKAALRYRPDPAVIDDTASKAGGVDGAEADERQSGHADHGEEHGSHDRGGDHGGRPPEAGRLFSVDPSGKLVPHEVTIGLSSSRCTEVRGASLEEGLEVVTGVQRAEDSAGANPFQRKAAGEDHHRPAGF